MEPALIANLILTPVDASFIVSYPNSFYLNAEADFTNPAGKDKVLSALRASSGLPVSFSGTTFDENVEEVRGWSANERAVATSRAASLIAAIAEADRILVNRE